MTADRLVEDIKVTAGRLARIGEGLQDIAADTRWELGGVPEGDGDDARTAAWGVLEAVWDAVHEQLEHLREVLGGEGE
jgi:hypothetical protein